MHKLVTKNARRPVIFVINNNNEKIIQKDLI